MRDIVCFLRHGVAPMDGRRINHIRLEQAMGTWGVEIFEDDVACDVRGMVQELLAERKPMPEITDIILERFATLLSDEEDGPVVVFALAAAQCEAGRLEPRAKKQALTLIDAGVDPRWREEPEYSFKRRKVLKALAKKLRSFSIDKIDHSKS